MRFLQRLRLKYQGKQAQAPCLFLTIPLELRLKIYEIALDEAAGYYSEYYISETCHQIRNEVLPLMFQQSGYHRSLIRFSKWTANGNPNLLKLVRNISIQVSENCIKSVAVCRSTWKDSNQSTHDDPPTAAFWQNKYSKLIDTSGRSTLPNLTSGVARNPRPLVQDRLGNNDSPHGESVISSFWNALQAISEVDKIWLTLCATPRAFGREYFHPEHQIIMDMVTAACQNISDLTVFSGLIPLDYLRNLKSLRQLHFTGYSKSTPRQTLSILRSLPHLNALTIECHLERYGLQYSSRCIELPPYISVTPEVVENMNPLKSFQIFHSSLNNSLHLTIPMIKALAAHKESLLKLHVRSDQAITGDLMENLMEFIASSKIRDLHLKLEIPGECRSWDINSFFPAAIIKREWSFNKVYMSDNEHLTAFSMSGSAPLSSINY